MIKVKLKVVCEHYKQLSPQDEYKKVYTLGKTVYSDITRCSPNFPAGYLKALPVGSRKDVFDVRNQKEMKGGMIIWKSKKDGIHEVTFAPLKGIEESSGVCFDYEIFFKKLGEKYENRWLKKLKKPDWRVEEEEEEEWEVESVIKHYPASAKNQKETKFYDIKYTNHDEAEKTAVTKMFCSDLVRDY